MVLQYRRFTWLHVVRRSRRHGHLHPQNMPERNWSSRHGSPVSRFRLTGHRALLCPFVLWFFNQSLPRRASEDLSLLCWFKTIPSRTSARTSSTVRPGYTKRCIPFVSASLAATKRRASIRGNCYNLLGLFSPFPLTRCWARWGNRVAWEKNNLMTKLNKICTSFFAGSLLAHTRSSLATVASHLFLLCKTHTHWFLGEWVHVINSNLMFLQ